MKAWRKWSLSTLLEDVRAHVDVTNNGCWLWTYGVWGTNVKPSGYPCITIAGHGTRVSRWILHVLTGEWHDVARHKCDTPRCVNPDHLEWGTRADNARDAAERRTLACGDQHWTAIKPHLVQRGARNPSAKLTDEQVEEIVAKRATYPGHAGAVELGREYGVSSSAIYAILRGDTYRR